MTPLVLDPGEQTAANFLAPALSPKPGAPAAPSLAFTPAHSARISATILTKDSEAMLAEVLQALTWCDEVVIL
ncbi:MAG TPA: hypothetical protein VL475_13300, partial [Planctomycetaceae bacterium]|nr:hypothetical protein [Planctomycetaceae bacterium]